MRKMTIYGIFRIMVLCGFRFFRYLWGAGISSDNRMIILSSHEGANWGCGGFRSASTLINLRRLDLIRHLEMFISSLVSLLPQGATFVGRFAQHSNGSAGKVNQGSNSGLLKRISWNGSEACQYLNRDRVSELLEDNGLVIINMTEISGMTYFHGVKRIDRLASDA
ncbi:MAG: hypothetical protein KDB91_05195 [Bacteroidales bacterium]|jgi:hypothetical protein|nr:hypothetical protein [Bacteroidales bacterium]NLD62445.1 hypothetical protein [Bacteroidales bacterium]HNT92768.1 hypothetical protein [Bacteroidales bacterium]HOO66284.1 hypothetical protein [Bacteroidales bacterium]HPE23254.1 hypothetical protein [Bacteroidales bacterium]